jgi:hypothetical protein
MIMGGMLFVIILIVLTPITLFKLAKGENKKELGIMWLVIFGFSFIFFPIMFFLSPSDTSSSISNGPFSDQPGTKVVLPEATYTIEKATTPTAKAEQKKLEWGTVAEFGMITTIWISPDGLKDKNYIAQILHQIGQKKPNNAVWFFDDQRFAAKGVPMTDQQMLHWVGLYDKVQSSVFCYVQIANKASSPPEIKLIKTGIMPGYAE